MFGVAREEIRSSQVREVFSGRIEGESALVSLAVFSVGALKRFRSRSDWIKRKKEKLDSQEFDWEEDKNE